MEELTQVVAAIIQTGIAGVMLFLYLREKEDHKETRRHYREDIHHSVEGIRTELRRLWDAVSGIKAASNINANSESDTRR